MMPLVSVCMTTYNHEPYIAQAIESVLNQRCSFDVEVVLGEDCSSDNTLAICRKYEAQYPDKVRVITSTNNVGMKANYRRTIEACRAEYIAMCDGDDWFSDPDKLQLQIDTIQKEGCAMCYTRSERRKESGSTIYPSAGLNESFETMLVLNTAENCTVVAKKELILQYYDEVKPETHPEWLTDDLPMWLWFAATQTIKAIDQVTAVHRVLESSVSHSSNWQKSLRFCDSLADIMLWFDKNYGKSRQRAFLLRRKQNDALWVLSYHGTIANFIARWWSESIQNPILFTNIAAYGLFAKKIFYRMWL